MSIRRNGHILGGLTEIDDALSPTSENPVQNKVVAQLAPIIGTTAPTTSTVGVVGQLYVDTATSKTYHCVSVTNTGTEAEPVWIYTWEDDINSKGGTFSGHIKTSGDIILNAAGSSLTVGFNQAATTRASIAVGAGNDQISPSVYYNLFAGEGLIAVDSYQSLFGHFNVKTAGCRISGYGADSNHRANIEELTSAGNHYIAGGHQQGITVIPASTSAYTLTEGASQHTPNAASEYALPAITQRIIADGMYFTRNTAIDGTGYYGWINGTTNRYTASPTPAVGTNTYTNTTLTAGAKAITAIDNRTHEITLEVHFKGYTRSSTDDSGSAYAWKSNDGSLLYTDTETPTPASTKAYSDTALTTEVGTVELHESYAIALAASYSFEDSEGNPLVPMGELPDIIPGSVVQFLCRWSLSLNKWCIMAIPME